MKTTLPDLTSAIARDGSVFARSGQMRELLQKSGWIADWNAFAASWDGMPVDEYLAEGHRSRRRRYAVYRVTKDAITREAHQPHLQGKDYNTLFGGVERWFEAIPEKVGESATMRTILGFCRDLFAPLAPTVAAWHVEVHQFRIEATHGHPGQPTPEGIHRDGVDYVCVLLVRRHNIASGTTTIHSPEGKSLGEFTLTDPLDAALIDDHRVHHGVTPVEAIDPGKPAFRDVLVITLRRE